MSGYRFYFPTASDNGFSHCFVLLFLHKEQTKNFPIVFKQDLILQTELKQDALNCYNI